MDFKNGSVNQTEDLPPAYSSQQSVDLPPAYSSQQSLTPSEAQDDKTLIKISGNVEPECFGDGKAKSSWSPPKVRPPLLSSKSVQERMMLMAGTISVEPVLFLFTVGLTLGAVTTQSLVIRKYCLLEMKMNDSDCRNLTANDLKEREAQELSSTLSMYKTIMETIPIVILALFMGPWSDKHGRKMLLLLPSIGGIMQYILMIFYAHFETELEPRYLLLTGVPYALTGGIMPLVLGGAAIISDTSTAETRIIRLSVMTAFMLTGAPLGTVIGSNVLNKLGYTAVYIMALAIVIICLLYVIFFVKETVKKPDGPSNPCSDFFQLTHIREGLNTILRKRENNHRLHLLLLILAMTINFFPFMGEMSVAYLYTRRKFLWNEVMYSYYTASSLLANMFGLLIVLPILKMVLKMPDIAIALIGACCRICSESMIAFAPEGWLLFAVSPLLVFAGMYSPILRGIMSHIVAPEEQGKLFSVLGASEAAMPIVGSVLYTNVYNSTSGTFPGTVFLMSALFFIIPTVIFIWLRRDINKRMLASKAKEVNTGETPL